MPATSATRFLPRYNFFPSIRSTALSRINTTRRRKRSFSDSHSCSDGQPQGSKAVSAAFSFAMGFLRFLRSSSTSSKDRDAVAPAPSLAPPTPSFHQPSSSSSSVRLHSSSQLSGSTVSLAASSHRVTDRDRDVRPPASSSAKTRKDKETRQRMLGIGRRENDVKSIPYSSLTPQHSLSRASIVLDNQPPASPLEPANSAQPARPMKSPSRPINIHQRTSSIPSVFPPSATDRTDPGQFIGSLDFGSPLVHGQGGMRFSMLLAESSNSNTSTPQDTPRKTDPPPPLPPTRAAPSSSPDRSRRPSAATMDPAWSFGNPPRASDSASRPESPLSRRKAPDASPHQVEKVRGEDDKDKRTVFWRVRNRRGSKAGEAELDEKIEPVPTGSSPLAKPNELKSTLREPHPDKPKLRRPSSHVWQPFAKNRTSSYNLPEPTDASALDTNESAIDDGSFQLKSFRHVSSASMSLPGALDQARSGSPTRLAPDSSPLVRPRMPSRPPSQAGSLVSVDDPSQSGKVSVAAFRKGIRAHSFAAVDKDSSSSRPSVAGTAPPPGVGPDDDLPLSFLAADGFKQKHSNKRPSLPDTLLTPGTSPMATAPTSPTAAPPSSFRGQESSAQIRQPIQRPKSVTTIHEASKSFLVLSRTASRTNLADPSPPQPSPKQESLESQEVLMPGSDDVCTSPMEMDPPSLIAKMTPETGRTSPALVPPRSNSLQPGEDRPKPIPVPSPAAGPVSPAVETQASSRPASFFEDPMRLISSLIGRDEEPRIPTPPPRSDDGVEQVEEPEHSVQKDGSLGLDLAGLDLPLPPHAMPDDGLSSPRSSSGRGPGPRPPLQARLASATGLLATNSPPVLAPLPTPEIRPSSLLSPAQIKPPTSRKTSQEFDWCRPPVRPKASASSVKSSKATPRGNADAWADSSSDDDRPPRRRALPITTPKPGSVPLPRSSLGNMRAASASSAALLPSQPPIKSSQSKIAPKAPFRKMPAAASSSDESSEEDASSSSSDEPLAKVKQKASMSSLHLNTIPKAVPVATRRPSAGTGPRPVTIATAPAMPRQSSSRSSMFALSPVTLNNKLPSPQPLASSAPKRSPQAFAPALRGQPSPASSVSGKTGDSSSFGAPVPSTPKDGRRVSFLPDEVGGTLKARALATALEDGDRESKRNERRREEAKNAVELGNVVNGPPPHIPSADPNVANETTASANYNPYMTPAGTFDPRLAWAMQQAATGSNYAMMHQQAMAYAKQQYQAAMAAAAMQAANDEWERSSAMTGFSGAPSLPAMPSYGAYPQHHTSPYGMPPMFPAMSSYAGSEYGGGRPTMYGSPSGGWGTQSVYGESFGPPPSMPPLSSMPRSSTASDLRSVHDTPKKDRLSTFDGDGATPRRRHFSSSSIDVATIPASSRHHDEGRQHTAAARSSRKAPLLQAHGGIPSAPSSWRRELDEREELDDRQRERVRPRGAR